MKLTNINTILTYISLVLAIAILLSVIFGCYFKKRNVEHFSTKDKDKKKDEKIPDITNKVVEPKKIPDDKSSDKDSKLSKFESNLIDGLSSGKMNNKDIEKHIKNGTFTKQNLENMINHVEKMQNKQKDKKS